MLIVALAIGAFDHLNCQHTRDFDQNFSKKSNAQGFTQGHGWFLELTGTELSQYRARLEKSRLSNSIVSKDGWCYPPHKSLNSRLQLFKRWIALSTG